MSIGDLWYDLVGLGSVDFDVREKEVNCESGLCLFVGVCRLGCMSRDCASFYDIVFMCVSGGGCRVCMIRVIVCLTTACTVIGVYVCVNHDCYD